MNSTFKKIALMIGFVAFTTSMTLAQSATAWKVDKAHTSVNFSVNHFFSAVTGKFTSFEGSINFDPNNLQASSASFTIPVASVNTDDAKRDKHLQSDDFFNVKKYPNISFKSTGFEKISASEYVVKGQLTIRDVTKNVSLPFKLLGEMEHPMMKNTIIMGVAMDTKLNRTDYGVGVGSWAATAVVGDEVTIDINMELNRKK
ncbi:polyisoprenoid-binding protein YceI [Dyadobacter jejuensis]|uniref:Polyisoprenoid-binding protein YceI n=1 Tax=Dyadobacter jejuensis TaxID=1082580 RepID=A0A316APA4_9BACT|nr:YceI family protein [Dyadobacter jejuensis]PWJ59246.1 polyisoprenoid-binding protein YceI [Dyadobacter jejuensis]